ncbi:MAG: polymer-forming cytoskeletal protein [Planctomycetota bacterium]
MALKPPLTSWKPQGPKPADARQHACPYCGASFTLSRKAVSVRCPGCTRPLSFEDMDLQGRVEGELSTMGRVTLVDHAEMVGRLTCGSMTSQGRFDGTLQVLGNATLAPGSLTSGQVRARALSVAAGATLRGRVDLGPQVQRDGPLRPAGNRLRPRKAGVAAAVSGAPVLPPPPKRPPPKPVSAPKPVRPRIESPKPAEAPRSTIARLARLARSTKPISAGSS